MVSRLEWCKARAAKSGGDWRTTAKCLALNPESLGFGYYAKQEFDIQANVSGNETLIQFGKLGYRDQFYLGNSTTLLTKVSSTRFKGNFFGRVMKFDIRKFKHSPLSTTKPAPAKQKGFATLSSLLFIVLMCLSSFSFAYEQCKQEGMEVSRAKQLLEVIEVHNDRDSGVFTTEEEMNARMIHIKLMAQWSQCVADSNK